MSSKNYYIEFPIQQKSHVRFVESTVKFSKSLVNFWKIQVKITTYEIIFARKVVKSEKIIASFTMLWAYLFIVRFMDDLIIFTTIEL